MKSKIFAANWKLYKNPDETRQFFENFIVPTGQSEVIFFPTALCVDQALSFVKGTKIQIGVQNISEKPEGAFTGENSAKTALEMGCSTVLIGHSERRSLFNESLDSVANKLKLAQSLNLKVMLCVGETLAERESGKTENVLRQQLETALKSASATGLYIAYEPVWAIGTGKTATPQTANETHEFIHKWLQQNQLVGTPILYGGSVKPENAKDLMAQPFISGFLVGGASLNPESFAQICQS